MPNLEDLKNNFHVYDCVWFLRNALPAQSIDLIVTSPPYNIRNSTGGGFKGDVSKNEKWRDPALSKGYETHNDNMPHDEYVAWQRECLTEMLRVLKDDGAIFYNHKWRVQKGLLQDRSDIVDGFPVRQIIIWQRAGGINFNPGYFLPTYEVIYLIAKPKFKLVDGGNRVGDVWYIPQERGNPHPAAFPVELAKRAIESTNASLILDPFMGSGSTAIAAHMAGRDWIGVDTSLKYCVMAKDRYNEYLR